MLQEQNLTRLREEMLMWAALHLWGAPRFSWLYPTTLREKPSLGERSGFSYARPKPASVLRVSRTGRMIMSIPSSS